MQIGKAARSNGSHIKSRLKMEPHGVFKEVTKQCTNKDHYQSVWGGARFARARGAGCSASPRRTHPPTDVGFKANAEGPQISSLSRR